MAARYYVVQDGPSWCVRDRVADKERDLSPMATCVQSRHARMVCADLNRQARTLRDARRDLEELMAACEAWEVDRPGESAALANLIVTIAARRGKGLP